MPTFRHAKNTRVLVRDVDLTTQFREFTSSMTVDTADATTFSLPAATAPGRSFVMGIADGSLQLGGLFSGAVGDVDERLGTLFGDGVEGRITVAPEGLVPGRRVIIANTHQSNYEITGSVGDVVAVGATFQGTGGLDSGYSLHDLVAETLTQAGETATNPEVDNGTGTFYVGGVAGSTNGGGIANLHVTSVSGTTPSLTVTVGDSADNVTFTPIGTFTAVTSTVQGHATRNQRVVLPAVIRRYVRANWTITGTTPSFTFHVNFTRSTAGP